MENISKILESGNSAEKIRILEGLDNADDPEILDKIIARLDDNDLRVRGEAFSSLLLNKNQISTVLINSLDAASKNIRAFVSLVLANRNDTIAIPEIMRLAKDKRSMVRSCAIGALGHLGALKAREVFLEGLSDSDIEVKKSALQAAIDLKITIPRELIDGILEEKDSEMDRMISLLVDQADR